MFGFARQVTWTSVFTRPNITHFEEKSRFLKNNLRKRKLNSRLLSKYKEILIYK